MRRRRRRRRKGGDLTGEEEERTGDRPTDRTTELINTRKGNQLGGRTEGGTHGGDGVVRRPADRPKPLHFLQPTVNFSVLNFLSFSGGNRKVLLRPTPLHALFVRSVGWSVLVTHPCAYEPQLPPITDTGHKRQTQQRLKSPCAPARARLLFRSVAFCAAAHTHTHTHTHVSVRPSVPPSFGRRVCNRQGFQRRISLYAKGWMDTFCSALFPFSS